ncbi:uncharacterized protein LOC127367882 [Dicentrarchus labrax]|uniref:uncharacterized protein LOC127367882 n=1 Tax=Dicentrarchus labrax TaxID=13489 RepID=UPI0021F58A1D|nr:uncharacterized protein LOC127367882 [Dicentrarchus labrax]XP_051264059.1 uncharacterized protein LOC127367882 [Dicentrarchus labrax]XP_051264061.1 uncharacterized protein LOC127367882 [Dicentrarchus labrax]XP_051264062.1 uncharacterized protein LOC127367882 [Dicentrarchus labrax]
MEQLDCQNNPNVDACPAGPSQAAIIDQKVGSSADIELQNEQHLQLWNLRANNIQRILSIPHKEHCPLYPYSRCKKLGIDFNVGSGVKQNLDPKLLTNGIMAELNTFATAMLSARKHFITEILEYNFDLNLTNELLRSAFAQRTMSKMKTMNHHKKYSVHRLKMFFELPDTKCIQESMEATTTYCPKCHQDQKLRQDQSDPGHLNHPHPHTMTDTVSADANSTSPKPAKRPLSTFLTTEETAMNYPRCKKIGLNLCVDKDQPKDKLDRRVLTLGIVNEVNSFASKLSGTKGTVIVDVLKHNFNIGQELHPVQVMYSYSALNVSKSAWLNEVFVIQSHPRQSGKQKRASVTQRSDLQETIKKRRMSLLTNEKRDTLPSHNTSAIILTTKRQRRGQLYPFCKEIGLDLDVTSGSTKKEKLDLKLLTTAVVCEIHKFASEEAGNYYPRTVFYILDANFDLSSQYYRRWEFSVDTAAKVQNTVKQYCEKGDGADEVFKLPFVFAPKSSQKIAERRQNGNDKKYSQKEADKETNKGSCENQVRCHSDVTNKEPWSHNDEINILTDPCTMNVQMNGNLVSVACGSPLQGNIQIKEEEEEEYNSHYGDKKTELDAEEEYHSHNDDVKAESNTGDVKHLVPGEPAGSLGADGSQDFLENPTSSDIPKESESSITTDVSFTLPTVNSKVNPPFASQPDEKGLCGREEQTQTLRNAPNECDMEQEEIGTEHNMWKLRANRVKQILSALNNEFNAFFKTRKFSLEFNVGFGPKQNLSVDSLTNAVLLKIEKFALAINSSQQNFIMEILEYNFDLGLQSQHHRDVFACEIMKRVRQLGSCEDAVRFSNEVFELPGPIPSIDMTNQSVGSVIPELDSISRMEKCDVAPMCQLNSHAKTKECISLKNEDLYHLCKGMGLKLHVNNSQPNKKLEINKLTNGAMTAVTTFAEKLCGTFEQICLDILRHNFDLNSQSGDSDLAKNILARIPVVIEQKNLSTCTKSCKKLKRTRKDSSTMAKQDLQNNPDLDACSAGSSQAAVTDQNVASSADTEHKNEYNLLLWKLRANHIQQILSVPHEEHCPLYSYSRCKKLGIDFNVGSGAKQNLDPKLLTNGIMVELNTFATALLSARMHFIIEILEHNFDLKFKNEQCRNAFAEQTMEKIRVRNPHRRSTRKGSLRKKPFELPDMSCIQEPTCEKTNHCPKCPRDRNHKLHQDEFDAGHMHHSRPHAVTDTVSANVNCTPQKPTKDPSSSFSTTENTIMDGYPYCKKVGFNLCVDKDQLKDKLETHVLTRGIMMEVAGFAKKLCGTNNKVVNDVIEHNFNIGMDSRNLNPATLFRREIKQNDGGLDWFNKVFGFQSYSHRPPGYVGKVKRESAMHRSERKETIKKRKLALQTKEERATLPTHNASVVKSKKNHWSKGDLYPICMEIGLDLDVTSKSKEKEKLDLKLLTRAVVLEMHIFATQEVGHYYPRAVFDILDYNFDVSSQYYRRLEFSIDTATEIQTMVKQFCEKGDGADKVFKLPFVFDPKACANSSLHTANKSESSCLGNRAPFITSSDVLSSSPSENSNMNSPFGSQPDTRGLCGGVEQTQIPGNVSTEGDMEHKEIRTEIDYTCPLGESDLDSDEVTDAGSTGNQGHLENSDIASGSESSCLDIHPPFFNSTDVSSTLPTVNPPFASQLDEKRLCGGEEQTQTPINVPNECDMEQEETETNMWKLRSNRVEQILSPLSKEFGPFYRCKKICLEFNVGFGPKQNISVDCFSNAVLLELINFAMAINSSQKNFIMEILESNFNLGLQSQHHRNIFACEIMKRVRQLRSCEDAVKFSNEVFELPLPMPSIKMTKKSGGSVIPEQMEKCDVAPVCPPDSHETKKLTSHKNEDLYPACKEIGLKLHVKNRQLNKKLDFNKLTNGAMTEVTNFADKLCGTFEQICVDILRHNLDCDLKSGDSDLAENLLAQIPAVMAKRNLSTCVKAFKKLKATRKDISTVEKLDCQNNTNSDAYSPGSSQAEIKDQNAESSADTEHQNALNIELWKLRANNIRRILSIPHEEHCQLYSYSRCKKLGIDFNVGSGVKQNLDPKLLTNGIMVEFNTFATALLSGTKEFVTEILEYNFDLNFKNDLYRSAFAQLIMTQMRSRKKKKTPFELPDMSCIQEPTYEKTEYCPKCSEDRNHKLQQDEFDVGHMHHPRPNAITDTHSFDVNTTEHKPTKDPSSTFSTTEQTLMDSYPHCKKIGLKLCVDKDRPKDKLDTHVLTRRVVTEVEHFAKKLCGTKSKIIYALLEHNFNIGMQDRDVDLVQMFRRETALKDLGIDWFSEVFVFRPVFHRQPGYVGKMTRECAVQRSEWQETIQKRKLALQTKEKRERETPSQNTSVVKSKKLRTKVNPYPICTEIGLDLDLTSKSEGKERLDFELLTTAVVAEIHKFITSMGGQYFPGTLFDILDYNFDLSSQYYRRLEFSITTASKVQALVKRYRKKRDKADVVFRLPFVFPPRNLQSSCENRQQNKCTNDSQEKPDKKKNAGSCVRQVKYHSDVSRINFLSGVKTNEDLWSLDDPKSPTGHLPRNVRMNESLAGVGCGRPLQGGYMKPEPDTEEKYHPHYDVKTESNTLAQPAAPLGYTMMTLCPISGSIKTESENQTVQYYILAQPQVSEGHAMLAVCPNITSNIRTELDTAGGKYSAPSEAPASPEYSMVTIGEVSDGTLIKEEPADSFHYGVVSYPESEVGIKQEWDPKCAE